MSRCCKTKILKIKSSVNPGCFRFYYRIIVFGKTERTASKEAFRIVMKKNSKGYETRTSCVYGADKIKKEFNLKEKISRRTYEETTRIQ